LQSLVPDDALNPDDVETEVLSGVAQDTTLWRRVAKADVIRRSDVRTRQLYFDISGVGLPQWDKHVSAVIARIREIGIGRMLFGCDGTADFMRPSEVWEAYRRLPLTTEEASAIAANVAPYLRA
jgi:hypothetical protein